MGGSAVVPGFIDGHTHPTGGGGEAGAATRVPSPLLTNYTRAGVTTIIGMLGTDTETRSIEELLASIRGLRAEGLGAWGYTGGYPYPPRTFTGSVRGDITHLDSIIGAGELALSDFRSSQPTVDELLRVASEANVAGMLTGKAGVVHLHLGDGDRGLELVRQALDASELPPRVFYPTHVNRREALYEEALDLARRGCSIDITAFPPDEADGTGGGGLSAGAALGRYFDAGLPPELVTLSSDCGGCLPSFDGDGNLLHMDVGKSSTIPDTVASLIAEGRALEHVLPAITSNPARHLRLAKKGRLEPGADADLVVLDEDHNVTSVMATGAWHVRDGEPVVHGSFERPMKATDHLQRTETM
jgi:beta-aspartyl-dipeptidase (metallo-type)